jgi:hypothetical protein
MSIFRRLGDTLKEGFEKVPFLGTLMHLDVILVFGSLAFLLINLFLNLGIIGTVVGPLAWYLFVVGLLMCWANRQTQFLYAGLFGYGAYQLISLLKSLFQKYSYFSFSALVAVVVYAGLGYLVMTKVKD